MARTHNRRNRFRPRLDVLGGRDCPGRLVCPEGETLFIRGDGGASGGSDRPDVQVGDEGGLPHLRHEPEQRLVAPPPSGGTGLPG
jgi:hypothetical protein